MKVEVVTNEEIKQVVKKHFEKTGECYLGLYLSITDTIYLNKDMSYEVALKTFKHEVVHRYINNIFGLPLIDEEFLSDFLANDHHLKIDELVNKNLCYLSYFKQ